MSETPLKPIKALNSSSDLRDFSQVRPLNLSNFFPNLWHSFLELLILNKFYHIALQVLANTIYFYPQSKNLKFEKAHSKFIYEFTSALNKQEPAKSKTLLNHESLWNLLQEISNFISTDPDSRIAPLHSLLTSVKISLVEKTDDYEDFPWKVENSILTLSLFENEKEFFLLHPKAKLHLPELLVSDEILTTDQGIPLEKYDNSDILVIEKDTDILEIVKDEDFESVKAPSSGKGTNTDEEGEKEKETVKASRDKNGKAKTKEVEVHEEFVEVVEEVKIIVEEVKVSKSRYEEMTIEIEEYQEEASEVVLEPASFCGANICARCSKELWKTTHFLVNTSCCYKNIYNTRAAPIPFGSAPEEASKECMFCGKSATRPSKTLCVCCFLNINVWNTKNYKPGQACEVLDMNHWVDISEGKESELMQCNFCDEFRHKYYMSQACTTCEDIVCLACLRRNSFISEGICSECHNRRKISLLHGKLRAS